MQAHMEFFKQQSAARLVRLKPLTIDDHLRNGALAHVAHHFGGGGRIVVHIDLGVFDAMCVEKLLGGPAVAAPRSGINLHLHAVILTRFRWYAL